ncbi:Ficolin-2 [Stylophora pistillata]|uniref:Ficolin-2 n=1 Tax=Stylophora pistillata TaxID=50429 RepID=A0A2B4SW29_STYPI|nr:Ficolin-2 [Stylophora pistillata]
MAFRENWGTSSGDDCRNILVKDPIPNMVMTNHVIRSVEVPNEGSCKMICYMEPNCVSINIGPVAGTNQNCELNNAAEENHAPFRLVNKPDHAYFAIENPCSSSPCLNNGTCRAGLTNKGFRCICRERFTGETCQVKVKRNCAEIYKSGTTTDGVYTIKPDNLPAIEVFCDQTTAGGGWTVFQKRLDGSVDFYRYWNDYKQGFGDVSCEFWLGLDKIHRQISKNQNVLRVDLEDFEGNTAYAEYKKFEVKSQKDKYWLIRGFYSGNAGHSFPPSRPFTTRDQDNE